MSIVFFCQGCGARFEVGDGQGGRRGRCRHCGRMMPIPKSEEVASPAAPATAGPAWLAAVGTDVALAPLTVDRLPAIGRAPARVEEEDDDSRPYVVRDDRGADLPPRPTSRPAGAATRGLRHGFVRVGAFFRWLNRMGYLISVPFLIAFLLGIVIRNRPMALTAATVVILLNVGRLAAGVANLVVAPFRDGVGQGVGFLVPPFTFVYLARHWARMRKPALRVIDPIATIVGVALAFSFVPWLNLGAKGARGPIEEIGAGVRTLETDAEAKVKAAESLDLNALGKRAEAAVEGVEGRLRGEEPTAPAPAATPPARKRPRP